jgi:hypothetical protein
MTGINSIGAGKMVEFPVRPLSIPSLRILSSSVSQFRCNKKPDRRSTRKKVIRVLFFTCEPMDSP